MSSSLRSFWPSAGHPLGILTDRQITNRIKQGFYGRHRQAKLERGEQIFRNKQLARELRKVERTPVKVDVQGLW